VNERTDQNLLHDYFQNRSETAFAELVRRHVDFVYSAALRLVGNPQSAEDVTQAVFVALAQNAARLTEHPVLSGWLHCTTRNLAANTIRANVRRTAREQEAAAMNELLAAGSNALWDSLAPHLDAALGELTEADRDALLMRYFERKSAREMAQILGTSEEAAQKRVTRAVERVREFFSKRGITIGAAGLVVAISANAVQAAPVGLAATISASAILAGAAVHTSTTIAATKVIAMTTAQKTFFGLVVAAAVATPLMTHLHAESLLHEQESALHRGAETLAQLQTNNGRLAGPAAFPDNSPTSSQQSNQFSEVLKLRGEITRLQSEVQELANSKTNGPLSREEKLAAMRQLYADRIQWLKDLFASNPSQAVPELRYLPEDKWRELVQYDHHAWDPDNTNLLCSARESAQAYFMNTTLHSALRKFLKQNAGQFPTDPRQLQPYFTTPVDSATLQDWTILPMTSLQPGLRIDGDWAITQKAPVNAALDQRFVMGANGMHLGPGHTPENWALVNNQP
jgi:RNA polymerase sigma factor (sigma-70 family)